MPKILSRHRAGRNREERDGRIEREAVKGRAWIQRPGTNSPGWRFTSRESSPARRSERTLNVDLNTEFRNVTDATGILRLVKLTVATKVVLTDVAALCERLGVALPTRSGYPEKRRN
jgi:hypothetical protein